MGISHMKRMLWNVALSAVLVLAASAAYAGSDVAAKSAAALEPYKKLPTFQAARDAGATVVAAHLTGFEQAVPGGASAVVPIDYKTAGALLAHWAIAKTDGKVNAVVLVSNEALSTDSMVSGIKEVFGGCPNC